MNKYNLNFISDTDLFNHVSDTIKAYRFNINLSKFNKNLLDPIKLTFDSKVYNRSIEDLIKGEVVRQMDKSNSNYIGYFNQNIFKYIGGQEWTIPKEGFDVINEQKHIYVEIKNKHNTMNSSSAQKIYMKMQDKILRDSDAICMLVEVIAKKSQNITWEISLNSEKISNNRIRRLSIDKFYELVTGDKFAFKKITEILPKVITDSINSGVIKNSLQDSVIDELKAISPDILKSIYLLGFNKYEGFKDFNFR